MRLPTWPWRLTTAGKIAVANMIVVVVCVAIYLALFPLHEGVPDEPVWKHSTAHSLGFSLVVLSSPVSLIVGSALGPDVVAIFFPVIVPMNAYAWGYVGQKLLRRIAQHGRETESPAS